MSLITTNKWSKKTSISINATSSSKILEQNLSEKGIIEKKTKSEIFGESISLGIVFKLLKLVLFLENNEKRESFPCIVLKTDLSCGATVLI